MKKTKGQYTVIALIATLMVLLAFARLYPVFQTGIGDVVNCTTCGNNSATNVTDSYTSSLVQMIPFFILLAIILTTIFTVLPVKGG